MKFILGKKLGMTQIWKEEEVVAVTKVQADPCVVTQVRDKDKDGYKGVQLGFMNKKKKNINKPQQGHMKKVKEVNSNIRDDFRYLREFRLDGIGQESSEVKEGDVITVDTFAHGDKVNVTGRSRGRGFQGVVKRYNFAGAIKTHGTKDQERMPGSAGAMGVGRIFKGKKMPGRMGGGTVTTKNLEIVEVDTENNIIYIKGSIAGSPNDLLLLKGNGELAKKAAEEVPSILESSSKTPEKEEQSGEQEEQIRSSSVETPSSKENSEESAGNQEEQQEVTSNPEEAGSEQENQEQVEQQQKEGKSNS